MHRPRSSQGRAAVILGRVTRIAHLQSATSVVASPGSRKRVGVIGARTRYLRAPMVAPLLAVTFDGKWGKVRLPWRSDAVTGWMSLRHVTTTTTRYSVEVLRGQRELRVMRGDKVVARMRAGVGAATSPTPRGNFWVTERVSVPGNQRAAYGSFAFGMSGLQTRLPRGWRGDDQLAIHGTGAPGPIGRAASAGCVRVSERDLRRLRGMLEPGTPVTVR